MLSLLTGALMAAFAQPPALPAGAEALHAAVRGDNIAEAQRLIDSGVSVNARDALGSTPLHDAAWAGDSKMVRFLIDRGADVNARHLEAGSTPLHYAILTGRPAVVNLLLDAGADQRIPYRDGDVAIHLAASRGNLQILQMLHC